MDKLDLLARGEEDERLRLQVRAHEAEEDVELPFGRREHVVVLEARGRRALRLLVDGHVLRRAQREAREGLDVLGLRRREEQRLPRPWQRLHDRGERRAEAEVENTICLIEDEHEQPGRLEAWRLVEVLQQAARRAHEQVHPADTLRLLRLVLAADDQTGRDVVLVADHAEHVEDLHRELARW